MEEEVKTILDLCGGTGAWSSPYRYVDGYRVLVVDPEYSGPGYIKYDVKEFSASCMNVQGVLAAPPCTEFAGSGARWWKSKPHQLLDEAIEIVNACLRIIEEANPEWWCLENPVGRLPKYIGKWKHTFQPWEYGDPYTKRTCLWGEFNLPPKTPCAVLEGSKMWKLPPGPNRARLRSITPPGFAKAFMKANP